MKRKIFVAFIAMLSLVLMPMGVKAASYTDYFTINGYLKDENGRALELISKTNDITFTNDGAVKQLKATFLVENAEGKFEEYNSDYFYVNSGSDETNIGASLLAMDGGEKNDIVEANFKLVIDVNFDDYKSKVTVNLSDIARDIETGAITNLNDVVTEERTDNETSTEKKEDNGYYVGNYLKITNYKKFDNDPNFGYKGRVLYFILNTDKFETKREDGNETDWNPITIKGLKATYLYKDEKNSKVSTNLVPMGFIEGIFNENEVSVYFDDNHASYDLDDKNVKMLVEVDLDEYKSIVTVDLSKAKYDENGYVTNLKDLITEEVKVEDSTVISKDIFKNIKNSGNSYTYEVKNNDKLAYSWTFDGSKMTSSDFNIDLSLTVGAKDEVGMSKLVPKTQEKPLVLEFKHHGALPVGTTVKVNVADTYKDGDKITLYYYNEETKKLEEVATNIVVKDGFIEFALEHCSYYVTARTNTAPNNSQTSSMNLGLYAIVASVSLVGILYIVKTSKKEIA